MNSMIEISQDQYSKIGFNQNPAKIIFLGDFGVGKTSLLNRFLKIPHSQV